MEDDMSTEGTAGGVLREDCGRVRWHERTPNVMPDVELFRRSWNRADVERPPARISVSRDGNINTVGRPGVHEADDLDPRHPSWREAIEPGVWPLVDTLTTSAWSLVTYDSCAGHAYRDPALRPVGRRVGLLPRSVAERSRVEAALCRAVTSAAGALPPPVTVAVSRTHLWCGRTGGAHVVLDLSLDRAPGSSWAQYFPALDAATAALRKALVAQAPVAGQPCGCVPARARCADTHSMASPMTCAMDE
ncbi:hypothetical protein GCM10010124_06190 [Pilimelia terevasa]|uniref:Uncharacterized protein n=1 Tax=Pilimelia terevasa TaxID=53372 RepID=A0A8J3FGD2_9ACTN|nr:hypothetical protein [Pilimelia terevasa]GGK16357.1 hypothetical protein GCM10010124_06190 [Pilimelia terevasa]